MRSDMFKVIVEAPRRGWNRKSDGRAFRNSEEVPAKVGIRAGYRSRKWLNENLNPLKRYLHAQVGRTWDKVYSEICRTIDGRSTVKQHVLLHVEDFVAVRTKLVEGVVYVSLRRSWSTYQLLEDVSCELYVHPISGLLLKNRAQTRKLKARRETRRREGLTREADRRVLDARRQLHRIDGIWYLVEVETLPKERYSKRENAAASTLQPIYDTRWDVVRKAMVSIKDGRLASKNGKPSNEALYGNPKLYGASKRQLNSRELREFGLASK